MRILFALLLVSGVAFGQVNTTKKITFKEGETQKIGVNISGLTSITRVEVTFRNSLNAIVRKFSTVDSTIIVSDTLYVISFADLQSLGKAGRGTWQVEVASDEIGVKKTDVYTYEIYKAATLTGSTTPISANGYNYLFSWNFTPTIPSFEVVSVPMIVVDGQNIKELVSDSLDAIRLLIGTGGIDTTSLLQKTTAAALYVAKEGGKSLITDAERTKLSGIATGATANSTDAQLRDRATHTGVQGIATVTALQDSLIKKVNTTDTRLTDARTPTAHAHPQSDVTGLSSALSAKSDTSHTHTSAKIIDWVSAWNARFAAQSTTGLAEGTNLYHTTARVQAIGDARYLTPATAAATYQPIGSYLTSITSGNVTDALGYTPYNATNPNGYITSSALSPYLTTATAASTYQPLLVSGTSIKTVNGNSLLGSGDITIIGRWHLGKHNGYTISANGLANRARRKGQYCHSYLHDEHYYALSHWRYGHNLTPYASCHVGCGYNQQRYNYAGRQ